MAGREREDLTALGVLVASAMRVSEDMPAPSGAQFRWALSDALSYVGMLPLEYVTARVVAAARTNEQSWTCVVRTCGDLGLDAYSIWDRTAKSISHYGRPVSSLSPDPDAYEQVLVRQLPVWHNPYRCGHLLVWQQMLAQQQTWPHRLVARLTHATGQQRAQKAFVRGMQSGRLGPCAVHSQGGDLRTANDAVEVIVRGFAQTGASLTDRGVLQAVTGRDSPGTLSPQETLTASLLRDPITWTPGCDSVTNGQHRVCQARMLGMENILVRVG